MNADVNAPHFSNTLRTRRVKLAVIGLGWVAADCHLPVLRSLISQGWPVDIAALCDNDPIRLERVGSEFQNASRYADAMAMLAREQVDGVMILTPPSVSLPLLREAIKRNLAVFVEKPVALKSVEIEECAGAAFSNGVLVQVGYNRRYQPYYEEFTAILSKLEGPLHIEAKFWRKNRTEPIFYEDTVVHPLNLLQSAFGRFKVKHFEVTLPLAESSAGLDVRWLIQLQTNDARAIKCNVDIRPAAGENLESYQVRGKEASLTLTYPHSGSTEAGLTLEKSGEMLLQHGSQIIAGDGESLRYHSGFLHQLADFLNLTAQAAHPPRCTLADAAETLRLFEAIKSSRESSLMTRK